MRVRNRIGPCLLALAFSLRAQSQEWTEEDVLRQFEAQNPIARETRARQAIALAEARGRTLWSNPSIGVSREGAGRTEFYQASQALPLSGRFPLIRQAGALQAEALEAEGGFSLWLARQTLRAAFFRGVAAQERARVWKEASRELAQVIAILEAREREGEGSKLDRLRAEREQVEMSTSARLIEADLTLSRGDMLAYLPEPSALVVLSGRLLAEPPPATLPEWIAKSLAKRLDILAERRRLEQFRKEQQAAERLRIPEPTVNAGLKRAASGALSIENGPVVGVSVPLPLFNSGKAEVSRFAAEQERSSARLEQLTRRGHALIESAWNTFALRREARDAYAQAQTKGNEELVRIATLAYQEGEIGILQLLDAYRLRRDSQLRQIDLSLLAKESQIALEAQIGEEFPR
jgi:cobalt-zinc-cadmium efflux system outer membrane protein